MSNWWETSGSGWGGDTGASDPWAASEATAGYPEAADQSQWQKDEKWDKWGAANDAAPATEASSDNWGNWGASDTGNVQQPQAKAFWEAQAYNLENNILSKKEEWELEQDEARLFGECLGSSAGIDFAAYDTVPVDVSGDKAANIPALNSFEEIYKTFGDFIPVACIANVRKCQYSVPTPVQKYAVPVGLAGRDVMCCAQTGSGKTAAFLIPTIGLMMKNKGTSIGDMTTPYQGICKPDSLVMTPTRELCIQIHEESMKFCHRTGYRCCVVYGGAPTRGQMEDLAKGCDLMVATPGRLNDFINRGIIEVKETYVLVLDEADRMLDMGFEKQMREIVVDHGMPAKEDRQTLMFSATFPTECQTMAQDFLYNYIWIGVGIIGGAVNTVAQTLKQVVPKDKYTKLIEELDRFYETRNNSQRCLIFVNAKDTAKWLDEQLYDLHYDVGALHGNLTQQERETNLQRYRKGEIDVMVATDVAARGLDIEKVDLVVNYDLPNDIDTYVHRIGRSGRIGNKGAAVTFVSQDENGQFLDKMDVLQGLLTKMRDAGSAIPSWLEDQAQGNDTWDSKKDSWANWGGKDMRSSNGW